MIQLWIKAINQRAMPYINHGTKLLPFWAALIDGIKAKNPFIVQAKAPPVLVGHIRKAGPAIRIVAIMASLFIFITVNSFI
jgi:hypothetical protein